MDESSSPPASVSQAMGAALSVSNPQPSVLAAAGGPREATGWIDYVRRIAQGDAQAMAGLYDESSRLVYSVCLRILGNTADAEDVTLDVYTQIWKSAGTFNGERGSVVAWIMTITRTRAIDRQRMSATRRRREEPLENFVEPAVHAAFSSRTLGLERAVRRALATLSEEQRELIELAYFSGFSHSEMAERLGLPLGTIKTRIRLGMMKLRTMLSERDRE